MSQFFSDHPRGHGELLIQPEKEVGNKCYCITFLLAVKALKRSHQCLGQNNQSVVFKSLQYLGLFAPTPTELPALASMNLSVFEQSELLCGDTPFY